MAKPLRQLWQEHGYTSAKQLADEVGVSTSTMSRYESNPEEIPTSKACAIADALGVTVDEVLGRDLPEPETSELQRLYDALDEGGREFLEGLLGYLSQRSDDTSDIREAAIADAKKQVHHYEKQLCSELSTDNPHVADYLFGSPEEARVAFNGYLVDVFTDAKSDEIRGEYNRIDNSIEQYGELYIEDIPGWQEGEIDNGQEGFYEQAANYQKDYIDYLWDQARESAKVRAKALMGAYDLMHPQS